MARNWLSIDVELVSGRGGEFWPRPGRTFAAARTHTFWDLALAINIHFARWDLAHLSEFTLADGTRISHTEPWNDPPEGTIEIREERLSSLSLSERFAFEFDFGDSWTHLCTVDDQRIDPVEILGEAPDAPTPYWGWGQLPGPVRETLGRGRRGDAHASRPWRLGPPSDPPGLALDRGDAQVDISEPRVTAASELRTSHPAVRAL